MMLSPQGRQFVAMLLAAVGGRIHCGDAEGVVRGSVIFPVRGNAGFGVLLGRRPRQLDDAIWRQEWHFLTRWDDLPLISQAELVMHRAHPTAEPADELRARALRRDPGMVGLARDRFATTTIHADGISIVAPGLSAQELERLLGPTARGTVARIHRP